jgi:hypothetical protein
MINMAPIARKNARHTAAILSWVPKLASEGFEKQWPTDRFGLNQQIRSQTVLIVVDASAMPYSVAIKRVTQTERSARSERSL